jgi:hypothetical protein
MSDTNVVNGASIRHDGRVGRIVSVTEDSVLVAWHRKGLTAETEVLPRTSGKLSEDIQVLTLKNGWVPLVQLVGIQEEQMGTAVEIIAELKSIAGHQLDEAAISKKKKTRKISKYNPFKRYSPIGDGPNVEFGVRTVARRRDWRCKGSGYNQTCVGISKRTKGRTKLVHIDPEYKRKYNSRYKSWVSKHGNA